MNDADKLTRIGEAAAQAFSTTYADIVGGSKHMEPMQARIATMWVASRLMPAYHRKKIAQALGRAQGDAVGDAVRRVADLRARHDKFRGKVDDLYRTLEAELGVSEPPKPLQKHESGIPIGSANDISWGFSGLNTGTRSYFENQNKRFAEAMLRAGVMPRVAGPE